MDRIRPAICIIYWKIDTWGTITGELVFILCCPKSLWNNSLSGLREPRETLEFRVPWGGLVVPSGGEILHGFPIQNRESHLMTRIAMRVSGFCKTVYTNWCRRAEFWKRERKLCERVAQLVEQRTFNP